ncbi:hypothetical protein [Aliidiomarina soli]|uniref:Uncharacterized protein n=1 Tax=Aliidiomarina soli TaxID=1928574 RepID=A0A432WE51_9GAMM|nr:hypothetical protein [Aliidiomarina soli]RUO31135.1 hypothetical protein CWE14_11610 [Aliidiomarina soli]
MNAGFDNFKALYNQDVTDPVAWDINQLRNEQQVLQPVHKKYLGDRSVFIGLSNFFTDSEAAWNPVRLLPTAQDQTIEGGIDILNYESTVRFGCKLLGHSETQGCRP